MTNNKSKQSLLENNKFVLFLSLVLAIIFWVVLNTTATPESEKKISDLPVNIPISNSVAGELGLDVVSKIDTVSVKIVGPAYVVGNVSAEDITVTANLSNVTEAGKFTLDLRASKNGTNASNEYEIASVSPSKISVTFDYIDTKQFTVLAKANGASAVEGLSAEDAIVTNATNAQVSVKGARTEIEKISKIVAEADVNSVLNKTETFAASLKLLDQNDNELPLENYTITGADNEPVDKIEITVPIFKEKVVPIKARFSNVPKSYSDTPISHTLSANSIVISGQPEAVDLIKSISLSPIDFDGISNENYSFDAAVVLPDGIKSAENIETVTVTLNAVKYYTVKTFDIHNISVTSGSAKASLVRTIKNVKIIGPENIMKNLPASSLYAEIDLTGKEKGQHTVVVRVRSKSSDAVWQIGSYTATVTVK